MALNHELTSQPQKYSADIDIQEIAGRWAAATFGGIGMVILMPSNPDENKQTERLLEHFEHFWFGPSRISVDSETPSSDMLRETIGTRWFDEIADAIATGSRTYAINAFGPDVTAEDVQRASYKINWSWVMERARTEACVVISSTRLLLGLPANTAADAIAHPSAEQLASGTDHE